MADDVVAGDEFGPLKVLQIHVPAARLRATIVVDNVAAGPAIGGARMASDVTVQECQRLARAMTLKNAAAGLAHGGAKSVIYADPQMPAPQKEHLLRAFACAQRDLHEYIMGPDMGLDETCMSWVRDEIGRAVGLPRVLGGIPLDEIGATGIGIAHAAEIAAADRGRELAGMRFVVQGFGAVGMASARLLCERGAVLVGAADSRGAIYQPDGLDALALIAEKQAGQSVSEHARGERSDRDAIIGFDCDLWIPAARPDVIDEHNLDRLRATIVVPGANIAVTAAAERLLHARDVLCLPDFIANAGGVICAAVEYAGGNEADALAAIEHKVRANVTAVLAQARAQDTTPRAAAEHIALARLGEAMASRRWGVF